MKLYPKKIRSIADLEREKRRLIRERDRLEEEGIFSMDDIVDGIRSSNLLGGKMPLIMNVMSRFAPFAGRFAGPLVGIAQQWLLSSGGEEEVVHQKALKSPGKPSKGAKVKKAALTVGKDFLLGYLKWKAMELSYKGVRHLVEKRQAKKAAKQAR